MEKVTNIAFYRFIEIKDPQALQVEFKKTCRELGLLGTILLASEGINGMLAGSNESILSFEKVLEGDARFTGLLIKKSFSQMQPFKRLLVKVKNEVLTLKMPQVDPQKTTGKYVKPQELRQWLASGDEVVLVDTRNDFEVGVGTFKNALNPKTRSFQQFPKFIAEEAGAFKNKKIVTFCTGGIRCEKATALMIQEGFQDVYQLEGGILEYFDKTDGAFFEGDCFVFDHRVAVNKNLEPLPHLKVES